MYINKYKIKPRPSNKVQFIVLKADVLPAFQHATQIKSFFSFFFFPIFWHLCLFGGEKKTKTSVMIKRGKTKAEHKKHQTGITFPSDRHRTLHKRCGQAFFFFPSFFFFFFFFVCWVPLRSVLWPEPVPSGWATTKKMVFWSHNGEPS